MLKQQITRGFARTIGTYSDNAIIQKQVSQRLCALVDDYKSAIPSHILEIGCGTGFLTSALLNLFPNSNWIINDINREVKAGIDFLFQEKSFHKPTYLFEDAETIKISQQFDLITTSSCVQWFSDPKAFFGSISKQLKKNGLLAFSTFGQENLKEIKSASGQGLNYYSVEDYREMLSANFEIIYCAEDIVTIYFDNPKDVLKHIKATGVNGAFRQHWTKGNLAEFTQKYAQAQKAEGFPLTYHPIYFICKPL